MLPGNLLLQFVECKQLVLDSLSSSRVYAVCLVSYIWALGFWTRSFLCTSQTWYQLYKPVYLWPLHIFCHRLSFTSRWLPICHLLTWRIAWWNQIWNLWRPNIRLLEGYKNSWIQLQWHFFHNGERTSILSHCIRTLEQLSMFSICPLIL